MLIRFTVCSPVLRLRACNFGVANISMHRFILFTIRFFVLTLFPVLVTMKPTYILLCRRLFYNGTVRKE